MVDSQKVKELLFSMGADLCGIAHAESLNEAPEGHRPTDVFPPCKSVISFACRFPVGTLSCSSPIPYTRVKNSITAKIDAMALDLCIELEKQGALCIPIPTSDSLWDPHIGRWSGLISQKHAAQAAGLGTIGRHSLLITPEYGSMIWLGCVLCDQELEADERKADICSHCDLCVKACPVHALENPAMNQEACRGHAFGEDPEMRVSRIACHNCRDACPHNLGSKNASMA